jgi:succinate dehydrogenase / fumarate reductase cytochrome b subunit
MAARPVFLDFRRLRFPVGAIASIGHRISGVMLVLALPLAVVALEYSLRDQATFDALAGWIRLPAVLLAWACAHHLLAGIRHLLSDVGLGASLPAARRSAFAVLAAAAAVGIATLAL